MEQNAWQNFLTYAELSDVGLRRSNNQDSLGAVKASNEDTFARRGHLFIVADGMGAHAAGELASKMAVDTVALSYFKLPDPSPAESIRKAIEEANAKIHARGQANPDFRGMGTTSSALVVLADVALAAHVGDSRVYRLRGNRYEQLTADHSLVWEMMASSRMTEAEVPGYIPKNVITRSLGPSEAVQVDVEGPFPLADGDTFLVCSDGLSGQVSDDEMGVILGVLSPDEAVQLLVDIANLRGGPDNITVQVVRVNSVKQLAGRRQTNASAEPMNALWWVGLGVLALAAAAFAMLGKFIPAAVAGVMAILAGVVVATKQMGSGSSTGSNTTIPTQGKGPHRSCICIIDNAMLERLSSILEPVCRTAREQKWNIDWPKFQAFRDRAAEAVAKNDFPTAAREHCRSISFLVREVRDQQRRASDAPIDIDGPS